MKKSHRYRTRYTTKLKKRALKAEQSEIGLAKAAKRLLAEIDLMKAEIDLLHRDLKDLKDKQGNQLGYTVIRIGKPAQGFGRNRIALHVDIDAEQFEYDLFSRSRKEPLMVAREVAYYCREIMHKMETALLEYMRDRTVGTW